MIMPASKVSYASFHPWGSNSLTSKFQKTRIPHLKTGDLKIWVQNPSQAVQRSTGLGFCLFCKQLLQTSFAIPWTQLGKQPAGGYTTHTNTRCNGPQRTSVLCAIATPRIILASVWFLWQKSAKSPSTANTLLWNQVPWSHSCSLNSPVSTTDPKGCTKPNAPTTGMFHCSAEAGKSRAIYRNTRGNSKRAAWPCGPDRRLALSALCYSRFTDEETHRASIRAEDSACGCM